MSHVILYWDDLGTMDLGLSLQSTPGTQQYAGGKVYCNWKDVSSDLGPWSTCCIKLGACLYSSTLVWEGAQLLEG